MKMLFALAAVALLSLTARPPAADEPGLTQSQIRTTIAAMRDLRPVMEKHQEALEAMVPEEERAGLDPCAPPAKVKASEA